MAKQKKIKLQGDGIVYSTEPNFTFADLFSELNDDKPTGNQKFTLYVSLDKKQRAGKQVTLVEGFVGKEEDLNELGKSLKNHCGAGGGVKSGEILIQGDHREKVFKFLLNKGFNVKKKGG